jgi:excisionase family DNA binding protein
MPANHKGEMISTSEAAKELGVTTIRVRALISAGRLPALQIGRDWIIRRSDLDLVRVRKPGRPSKK